MAKYSHPAADETAILQCETCDEPHPEPSLVGGECAECRDYFYYNVFAEYLDTLAKDRRWF